MAITILSIASSHECHAWMCLELTKPTPMRGVRANRTQRRLNLQQDRLLQGGGDGNSRKVSWSDLPRAASTAGSAAMDIGSRPPSQAALFMDLT